MTTAYYTLFYQILRFVFWVRTEDTQEWTAIYLMSFVMFLNVATLYEAGAYYLFPYGHKVSIVAVLIIFSLIVLLNYKLLLHNDIYQLKATLLKQSSWRASSFLVASYIIISCILAAYYFKRMHDINVSIRR